MLLPPFLMEHFPLSQINDLTKEKYRKKDVKGKWMDITSESCYTISKNRSLSRLQQKKQITNIQQEELKMSINSP